jgi:hypothetical protein
MAIVFGTRPYGKCDVVPELFYVATWFFHIDYVPLIPTGSRLILGRSGNSYQVVKLPLSIKSLFLAWARMAFCIGMIGTWWWAIMTIADPGMARDMGVVMRIVVAVFTTLVFVFLMVYPRRKMPSYERACQLATIAGFNETGWAALNVLYGRDPLDRPDQIPPSEVLN